jgi:transcription factor 7-like 2
MARHERMKHMQLYPGWSARDNYGVRKKRVEKGKKRGKTKQSFSISISFFFTECLNQKKCRARFGLEQQVNWCKHCKRKKKCLWYTENETTSTWTDDEDDTDSNDCDVIIPKNNLPRISTDSDEENKSRLLR